MTEEAKLTNAEGENMTPQQLADLLEKKMAEMPTEIGRRALKLYMLAQFCPAVASDIAQRAIMVTVAAKIGDGKTLAEASVAFMAAIEAVDYVYATALIPTLRGAAPGDKLDVSMPPDGTKFH